MTASSLGGGRVQVCAIDGLEARFTGELPTLIIRNQDRPGMVAEVTGVLSKRQVNIATMQLYRDMRGGLAVMVIESDQPIWAAAVEELRACLTWRFHRWRGCSRRPGRSPCGGRCWRTTSGSGGWTRLAPGGRWPPSGRP
ncbi:L-serine dehydratase%2C beta chain [Flavonifractor plautii]|uniref:L-serine dehydratase, beta chain n=1 Tax=Flavonifractor plautii TaxID=292800 RepID=A0A174VYR9_FLAPL|nr:L-serine dehydratase%2C beta chain [Flavonifractor plautii]